MEYSAAPVNTPPSLAKIKPGAKLAEQVADVLEQQIRGGAWQAGEKLPSEAVLVQQLGVSRTVVREAISRLKSRGLVEARQGSGVFACAPGVAPLSFEMPAPGSRETVLQIVEVRRALEGEVAQLAAARRSSADVQAIRAALAGIAQAVAEGRDGVEEDVRFHRAIAEASHNPFLTSTLDYLSQFLRGATRVTRANEARRGDFARDVTEEHEAIVRAIEAGDPAAARAAAARHMQNAARRIVQADPAFWDEHGDLARALVPPTVT